MRSITSYLDFTLILQQSGIGNSLYEIHFGDELLGSIHMSRFWNSRAEAVSADAVWSFDRQGLFKPKITASMQNGDIVAALIDGETTLKRYVIDRGRPYLKAENSLYPNQVPARELRIQGVMVSLIRKQISGSQRKRKA